MQNSILAAQHLGFEDFIPPYASTTSNEQLLTGVNFASAAAGIRDETGRQLVYMQTHMLFNLWPLVNFYKIQSYLDHFLKLVLNFIRHTTGRQNQLRRAGEKLSASRRATSVDAGRRGLGSQLSQQMHLHSRHGQQRLPEQLLPANLLLDRSTVHPRSVCRCANPTVFSANKGKFYS